MFVFSRKGHGDTLEIVELQKENALDQGYKHNISFHPPNHHFSSKFRMSFSEPYSLIWQIHAGCKKA